MSHEMLATPELLPISWDRETDRVLLVRMTEADYEESSFLDERLLEQKREQHWRPWPDLDEAVVDSSAESDFIFHMGHVGSSLVSRILGENRHHFCLREPAVLRLPANGNTGDPGGASRRPFPPDRLATVLRLCARVFHPGQRSLVKATSFVNELAVEILNLSPSSRAILLCASPQAYLSNLLAGRNSRPNLRKTVASVAARLARVLPDMAADSRSMSDGEIAAMSWACEILALGRLAREHPGRVLWVDFDQFLARSREGVVAMERHLSGCTEPEAINLILQSPHFHRYAKAPEFAFNASSRQAVLAHGLYEHRDDIDRGLAWLKAASHAFPELLGAAREAANSTHFR